MRIKIDENLPEILVGILAGFGHNVDTVLNEKLKGASDSEVWRAAQNERRFFITQDLDFSDVRSFKPGNHEGLLLIRLQNPGMKSIVERIKTIFQMENVESWRGSFIVATDRKIRISRPDK